MQTKEEASFQTARIYTSIVYESSDSILSKKRADKALLLLGSINRAIFILLRYATENGR